MLHAIALALRRLDAARYHAGVSWSVINPSGSSAKAQTFLLFDPAL